MVPAHVINNTPNKGLTCEVPVLYFDGVCNLCNRLVKFVLRNSKNKAIIFASLQSKAGLEILNRTGQKPNQLHSVVFEVNGNLLQKSDAILALASTMGGVWKSAIVLKVFPRGLRDFVYDRVAANRYSWFGKKDQCMLPTPETAGRFLK